MKQITLNKKLLILIVKSFIYWVQICQSNPLLKVSNVNYLTVLHKTKLLLPEQDF